MTMRRRTVQCRIVNCYVEGEMGVNGNGDDGRMVLVLRVLLSLGDRGTSNEQENKRNRGGGTAFRNRATRKPPRPQHLDCNLALIDIQIVIPEQLGSTEIVHGQLSLDCALPSAPPSGIFQAHIAKTTEGMPDSVLGCVKMVCKVGSPPAAPSPKGKLSNIQYSQRKKKSRDIQPWSSASAMLCVKDLWFLWSLTDPIRLCYLSQKPRAPTHPIGGLPTARTRNSETVSIALPVYRASPTLPFHPSQRRALRKHTCQLISPHLPGPSLDYTYYYALFNPVPPLYFALFPLPSQYCQRVHPFSGVIVEHPNSTLSPLPVVPTSLTPK
ncbi:hypothetical protein COCVIDRAFT_16752 [Bipolaris victoriae FI3]|uniref:Uncharacterized protein n=1 Tax=Bipolaris victoriae (strain FI3) TaxID=930091 RepID=W7EHB8_BIPV3|nr:hypothetical protein COCVIDRAFT_16752 [Bipolaris victoriae FI3]